MAEGGSRSWGMWLLRVLGVALLAYVLWQVNWNDSLVLANDSTVSGKILGDLPHEWGPDSTVEFQAEGGTKTTYPVTELKSETVAGSPVPIVNEGIFRIVRRSDRLLLFLGILAFGFTAHFGIWRWWLLLHSQGIRVSFWLAHKLTFLGLFFNNVVPGATGGDLVKAVYLARHTEQGARSFATVMVDRITGIVALALIAAIAITTELDNPDYRKAAYVIFGFLGCFTVGCILFFSRTLRRLLHVDELAARLPGGGLLKKLDDACLAYRDHKITVVWAMLLSFANQLAIQAIMIVFAYGLNITTRAGESVPVTDYLVILPVGFIVAAIPALPGGWGIREGAFALFFANVGVGRTQAVALSVLGGLMMLIWSLLGGVYFLLGRSAGKKLEADLEAEAGAHDDAAPAGTGDTRPAG